jgi:DNA processing protein
MEEKTIDWLALTFIPGLGRRKAQQLLQQVPSPAELLLLPLAELKALHLSAEAIDAIRRGQPRRLAIAEYERALKQRLRIIGLSAADYPPLLRQIADPPLVLYVRGNYQFKESAANVAFVGSRNCTSYGKVVTTQLTKELVKQGVTIVSGAARGIDTIAHQTVLQHQGQTIAVVGNGLDIIYPKENDALIATIAEHGAIISELPLGTPPLAQNFPFRNRIIAGICHGVVVVEAAERSGSLITARMALEQNREVFAVPGNITTPTSFGPHYLIKEGAKLVQTPTDILEELANLKIIADDPFGNLFDPAIPKLPFDTPPASNSSTAITAALDALAPAEKDLYDRLSVVTPRHIDDLATQTGQAAATLLSLLLHLEIKDLIHQLPGKYFLKSAN